MCRKYPRPQNPLGGMALIFTIWIPFCLKRISLPKKPKKGIKRIITQDTSELEKEYFTEYLNYERERRKELREAAKASAEAEAEAEESGKHKTADENKE